MKLDSYDTPEAEALLEAGKERRTRALKQSREVTTQIVAAASLALAASLLAALAPWHGSLDLVRLVLVVGMYLTVERVRFPVGGAATSPTMLAFVPMLFLLPTPLVPLVAMGTILIGGLPRYVRHPALVSRVPSEIADAWYSFGPALVLVLAGGQAFGWSHWPIYAAALAAQVLCDLGATVARCSIGEGIDPRVQLPLLSWIYVTDAALWPLGLLIAGAAVERPGLVLLALSPAAILSLFARERQERLEQTVALSTAYRGTALLLGEVIDADDAYTGIHSRQVVDLSIALADVLGVDPTGRRNVEFAALLHDVGKIHVPKHVLNKPDRLDEEEWKILRRHTIDGERMLRRVGGSLANVGQFVRSSHERYDGTGYPDGLRGQEIPLESRIVSVCDAFNAMTTDRPYRSAMSEHEALDELRSGAGTQFDPTVVAAFERLVSPPPPTPRVRAPRWVRLPNGQAERALDALAAEQRVHEPMETAAARP